MNSSTWLEQLQTSLRLTLGATAALVETLQDPYKREENISRLRQEWSRLSEEWVEKGEVTEQEARNFVDTIFRRSSAHSPSTPPPSASSSSSDPDVQQDLQELTARIAELRAELEQLRNQES